ncbi:MAG TPA: hypothetical protein VMZ28_01410 [Kofleriaceae bacterium]|nr:hypothetical protein [Kofleriaceae bacterium]
MRALIVGGLLAALTAAVGCNTYDPDLGQSPFRCGTSEPRCPRDYTCVSYETEEICELLGLPDGGDVGGDGGALDCADDSEIEPNDTTELATNTFIPSMHDSYRLVGLSICPDTDQDYFMFQIDVAGKNLRADLTYQSSRGQLFMSVLNSMGTVVREAEAVPGMPDVLRADVANMPQGMYYVQVRAAVGFQNNYTIDIVTSGG